MSLGRLGRALTANRAATAADADDPRLRGRTYAIPFDRVWREALRLAAAGQRGWQVVDADDEDGVIRAEARRLLGAVDDVEIRIGLDGDGQTRVDARSAGRGGRADLGANARRLGRFFRRLDRALAGRRGEDPPRPVRPEGSPP